MEKDKCASEQEAMAQDDRLSAYMMPRGHHAHAKSELYKPPNY